MYGAYGFALSASPTGPITAGSGGYKYQRLTNGNIAVWAPGSPSPTSEARQGTAAWAAIDTELRTGAPPAQVAQAVEQDAPTPSGFFSSLLTTLGQGDKAQGQAAVAAAAAQYGPQIVQGVSTMIANRGQSLAALTKKLANKQADYVKAKQKGNVAKATKLAYEIKGLQASIQQQQAAAAAAGVPVDVGATYQPGSTGQSWLPVAVGGSVVLVLAAIFLSRRRAPALAAV